MDAHSYVMDHCQKLRKDGKDGIWLLGGSFVKFRLFWDGKLIGAGPFRSITTNKMVEHIFELEKISCGFHTLALMIRGEKLGVAVEVHADGVQHSDSSSGFRTLNANEIYSPVCWEKPGINSYFKGDVGPGEIFEHINGDYLPEGWTLNDFDDEKWDIPNPVGSDELVEQAEFNYSIQCQKPLSIRKLETGHFLVDFGTEAIGSIELTAAGVSLVELRLGEELHNPDTVRFQLRANVCYQELWRFAHAGQTLTHFGVRVFRYAEILNYAGDLTPGHISRIVLHAPFDDEAVQFNSSNATLNRIWDLCKYTVKATAMDLYNDCFSRERICYEADSYINLLSDFAVNPAAPVGRRTVDYLSSHTTWPCEWLQMLIPIFHEYYMYTADLEMVRKHYDALVANASFIHLLTDGLVRQFPLEIIVDWPEIFRDGCESDGDYVAIPNLLLYGNLRKLSFLAGELGLVADAEKFNFLAGEVYVALNDVFFDHSTGLYVDRRHSGHSSLHTNVWALWNHAVPEEYRQGVVDFVAARGMACGVYTSQFVLEVLFENGHVSRAMDLILGRGKNSWNTMIDMGATITTECWEPGQKQNMSWAHPWGSAPANIIVRYLCGIGPLEPGKIGPRHHPLETGDLSFTLKYKEFIVNSKNCPGLAGTNCCRQGVSFIRTSHVATN